MSSNLKQEGQPSLAKGNAAQQFVGRRAKPTVPLVSVPSSGSSKNIDSRHLLGGKVDTPNPNESSGNAPGPSAREQSGSVHALPAAPSARPLLAGQFKTRTASLPSQSAPQEQSKPAHLVPTGQFKVGTAPLPSSSPSTAIASNKSPSLSASGFPRGQSLGISSKTKRQSVVVNTVNVMRQWSGKVAAFAGHVPQPPAPYMERYHTPTVSQQYKPMLSPLPKRWKRSRTLRVSQLMKQRRQQTGMRGSRLWVNLLFTLLAVTVLVGLSGTAYGSIFYSSQLSRVQSLANQTMPQSIRVYDRHGILLYEHYVDHRSIAVAYNDIPQVMRDAMVAAEDPTFWQNTGVDPQGILRAAVGLVSHSGTIQSGGSTITQQVVKNLSQQTQSTATRKLQEAVTAMGMVQQYPKAKILEMYFNVAPFDNADLGIEAAVETYFHLQTKCDDNGKCIPGVAQLSYNADTQRDEPLLGLARASLLASMPQNPTSYDPTKGDDYKQAALGRQKYVLTQMMKNNMSVDGLGPITPDIAQQAEDLSAQNDVYVIAESQACPTFCGLGLRPA